MAAIEEKLEGEYLFKFQFFVHDCALNKDFFNIGKPAIAIRFLDFPTLIIDGQINQFGQLKFGQGKKCNFKMHSEDLRMALNQKPFFIMFVDASPTKQSNHYQYMYSIQILASSNVSLNVFTKNNEFFDQETPNYNLRRNFLYLFDNMKNEVMKIEVSIGISLLEKREQEKLKQKLETIHPSIPNARITGQDKAALSLQEFNSNKNQEGQKNSGGRVQVHFEENDDPNIIIKANKKPAQDLDEKPEKQERQQKSTYSSHRSTHKDALRESKSQLKTETNIRTENDFDEFEREKAERMAETDQIVKQVEIEQRMIDNKKKQESSLQSLLSQPYQPPPMFYERKAKLQPEKALIQKSKLKQPQVQVVKEALTLQEQRHQQELELKERLITQQKDLIVRQNKQLQEKIKVEQVKEARKQDKDVIELENIQKIKELDVEDRYKVLEFLVKELISLKSNDKKKKKRRRSSSDEDSEENSQSSSDSYRKNRKNKKRKDSKKDTIDSKTKQSITIENVDNKKQQQQSKYIESPQQQEEVSKVESISVDENDQIIQSSRKEWEEDLTSTQNLGVSASQVGLSNKKSSKRGYVEQTVKLQHFDATNAVNKFSSLSSQKKRKASEVSDDVVNKADDDYDYDDDFESMSKSQLHVSMGKVNVKKNLQGNAVTVIESDTYSNEFESMGDSKTLSNNNEEKIKCFMCKQMIAKSQSLSHSKDCKKMKNKGRKESGDVTGSGKYPRKYSPIRETEDEELSNQNSKKDNDSDNYSSSKFDESGSSRMQAHARKQSSLKKQEERKSVDNMRESYMSSSISTEKPFQTQFSKNVADFMKTSEQDDESSSYSRSNEKVGAGANGESLNQMYEKYKKMQELLAKYNSVELEESSATISKSQ